VILVEVRLMIGNTLQCRK